MAEKLAALSAQLSAGHRPDWAAANLESPSRAYVARLLGAFAPTQDRGLAPDEASPTYSATTVSAGVSEASAGPVSHLIEPLSDRELDVMRVLAGGHTNQEIALALHVSVNTVKTHLKNIYGKLAVGTRRQAVAKARSLRLIP
ncbi:MAG: response regulator transcription factor [Anaerolineae bacterium]|nr:response regulator transcription factor [Anaerolineae bacterium]